MNKLSEKAVSLLADTDRMQRIADGGNEMAQAGHTWAHRAKVLHHLIERDRD